MTSSEIARLKTLRRVEKDGKILRRYQCIWFAHEKFPKKEIASLLAVNIDTVTDWIKLFNMNGLKGLRELQYEGRRPLSLDTVKVELLKHIQTESISKLLELQHYLKSKHSMEIEHSWLSRYLKKKRYCSYKKTRLIPGKIPAAEVQKGFISMMDDLYTCASNDNEQVLLFLEPMHQIHNNENDYA